MKELESIKAASNVVQEILELVEKERKDCGWSNFDRDDTPWAVLSGLVSGFTRQSKIDLQRTPKR
jgi:hypothetical protein